MSTLNDRVLLNRNAVEDYGNEVGGSIQSMLNCGTGTAGSCKGGSALGAWEWMKNANGVPVDSCMQYKAEDMMDVYKGDGCQPIDMCKNCMGKVAEPKKDDDYYCYAVKNVTDVEPCFGASCVTNGYSVIDVDHFGYVVKADANATSKDRKHNVNVMKHAIAYYGPITCELDASPMMDYKGGVLDGDWKSDRDHIISVVGWGISSDGVEYWDVRNSWGEYWGENGFMKLVLGKSALGIEDACYYVQPKGWGNKAADGKYVEFDQDKLLDYTTSLVFESVLKGWIQDDVSKESSDDLDTLSKLSSANGVAASPAGGHGGTLRMIIVAILALGAGAAVERYRNGNYGGYRRIADVGGIDRRV